MASRTGRLRPIVPAPHCTRVEPQLSDTSAQGQLAASPGRRRCPPPVSLTRRRARTRKRRTGDGRSLQYACPGRHARLQAHVSRDALVGTSRPPSRGPSSPPWMTANDNKHPHSPGPVSPKANSVSPPRPIEAGQPEPVRKAWLYRRGATWFQLSRPDPLAHYAELRTLLIQHAEHLAKEIDTRGETTRCQPSGPGSN